MAQLLAIRGLHRRGVQGAPTIEIYLSIDFADILSQPNRLHRNGLDS
jgi:hypothetical protein